MRYLPRALIAALLLLGILTSVCLTEDLAALPELRTAVTDLTGKLAPSERSGLEERLVSFSNATGSQVAVLILPSTAPETIEAYGIRVADRWRLGRKGIDDGVLLIVAIEDRAVRIEVGRGLEGAIPDAYAKRIIENQIVPNFKQGLYFQGINAAVDTIFGLIKGEGLPPALRKQPGASPFTMQSALMFIFFAAFVTRVLGWIAAIASGAVAFAVLATFGFGVPLAGIISLIIVLAVWVLGQIIGTGGHGGYYPRSGGYRGGGGGFSGGGGGFSGGGASGRW